MSNVTAVENCIKCKTVGVVKGLESIFLKYECPSCKYEWNTLEKKHA